MRRRPIREIHPILDPVAAAQAAIAADAAHGDKAIWITRLPDEDILARARSLAAEGPKGRPLFGVPFAVKDNIDVAGIPTTAACPEFAFMPTEDAPAVAALLAAGAILIGKTNLDQFATGLVGVRSPYGIPRNVFDAKLVPGGSSSGSACAVAAGIVPFALGTDTAGSGRVPAGLGNIVGLKPSIGAVSPRGMVPACRSIDTISIFARTVDEAIAVEKVIAFFDARDSFSRAAPYPFLRRPLMPPDARVKVANIEGLCTPDVTEITHRAAALFNAETVDIAPLLHIAKLLYDGPWVAERTAAMADFLRDHAHACHPTTRKILEGGLERKTVDAFRAFYQLADARRFVSDLFAGCDALLVPTAPFSPTLTELEADPIGPNSRLGTFTNFVNLCDLAAIAVPAGFDAQGLPVGVTLIGPAWSEGRLAALADHIHRQFVHTVGATGAPLPLPEAPDAVAPDETGLFCVGGHMAGLPLNGQITSLGGRFVREVQTAPIYRMFALGNRPGMLRMENGASLAGEIWALPTTAIGALLAQVPPPLGFGQVQLSDGPCLGFVAEPAGLVGALDITEYGGWRGWLAAGRPGDVAA